MKTKLFVILALFGVIFFSQFNFAGAAETVVLRALLEDRTGLVIEVKVLLINYKAFERNKRLYENWNYNALGAFYTLIRDLEKARLSEKVEGEYNNIVLLNRDEYRIGLKVIKEERDRTDIAWSTLFTPFKIDLSLPRRHVNIKLLAKETAKRLEMFWPSTGRPEYTLNIMDRLFPSIVYTIDLKANTKKVTKVSYSVEVFKEKGRVEFGRKDKRIATEIWMKWQDSHFNHIPSEMVERFIHYLR